MVHKPTIYQILRRSGAIYARSDAEKLLSTHSILVGGKMISRLDYQCNPQKVQITINGKALSSRQQHAYFMLHKPIGYVTSKQRDRTKKHVMELLHESPELMNSLFPVGRLDYDTSGLLIITNDGKFARKILNPEHQVEKEYFVEINGILSENDLEQIHSGFIISIRGQSYRTKPAALRILKKGNQTTTFSLILHEGKKRQIREMMRALGHEVTSLKRIRIGKLIFGTLAVGKYKRIEPTLVL